MEEINIRLPEEWKSWKITEYIGRGAYGQVCRAEKSLGDSTVVCAIKIVDIPDADSQIDPLLIGGKKQAAMNIYSGMVDDFIKEIRYMESLKGITNIVSIEDYYIEHEEGELFWRVFICMEYLQSLSKYLVEHTMEEDAVIRLGMDMCTALKYCAKKEIIHRDVKPDNIFVSDTGDFKLGDFGIARQAGQTIGAYSTKGTYSYMAPEIYHGESYGPTVDLYSIGLLLYRILNDFRDPFIDADRQIVGFQEMKNAMDRRMNGDPLPAPAHAGEGMAAVILKACAYDPLERYQSAEEMGKALQELKDGKTNDNGKEEPPVNQALKQETTAAFSLEHEISLIAAELKLSPKGERSFMSKVLREYRSQTGKEPPAQGEPLNGGELAAMKRGIYKIYSEYASWAQRHNVTARK